jgi:hypothetical protein
MIHEKYSSRYEESNGIGRITLRMVMKRRGTETGKRNKMGKDFVFSRVMNVVGGDGGTYDISKCSSLQGESNDIGGMRVEVGRKRGRAEKRR